MSSPPLVNQNPFGEGPLSPLFNKPFPVLPFHQFRPTQSQYPINFKELSHYIYPTSNIYIPLWMMMTENTIIYAENGWLCAVCAPLDKHCALSLLPLTLPDDGWMVMMTMMLAMVTMTMTMMADGDNLWYSLSWQCPGLCEWWRSY